MSAVALPLLLCTPWLSRRYRQKALYLMTLILTLAFLFMPLRPHFTKAVITLPAPSETVQQPSPALSANAKTLQTPSDLSTARYTEEHVQAQETLLSLASAQKSYTHPAAVPLSLIVPEKAPVSLTSSQILSAGYLLTAGGMLLYHLVRHAHFMRLVRRWQSKPLGGCYQVILDEEKARMGVKRTLTLHLCPAVPSPMLVGVKRPRILLPDETLDEQALRMVLRHEMTHMVRMDIPFKFLSLLSLCLHWFNPVMYLLQRKMNYLCETSCDEAVLKSASWTDVERYTRTILHTLRRAGKTTSVLSTHFSGGKKRMKNRILTMMDAHKKRLGAIFSALVLLLSLASGSLIAFGSAETAPQANEPHYLVPDALYTTTENYLTIAKAVHADEKSDQYSDDTLQTPVIAYTWNPLSFAVPAGNLPTSWSMPDGQYLPGVPVQIIGRTHTSGDIENYTEKSSIYYAQVKLLNDDALTCYIPLVFLSLEKPETPPCTITLTTQDSIGFVTVYQQRSVDSTPVNAYQKGTQLQVIGRQSGWYHVSIDGVTGYVQAENAILSPEGEKLFDNQLFRFEGFLDSSLLGEGEKRDTYNRLLEQAFETYGEEKSYWTLEQKAWYSQLTRDYGYLSQGENVNILPNDHDISQEEALKKALEHIQKELNTQLDIQWFTTTYSLCYNWGEGEENAFWTIRFWPMNRMLGRYVVTMDRQGNLVKDIYTDIPESEQKVLDTWGTLYDFDQFIMANPGVNPEDVLSEEVLEAWAQWVGDTAPYADYGVQDESIHSQAVSSYGNNNYFWPLDVRVAAFGGSNSIPQPGELTEEEAKEMAVQAIINERGQEALDALGEYKTGAILERFNEGTEEEYTRWMIFVTDDPDIFLNGYRVTLSQRPGQGVEGSPTVQTLDDTSNG